MEVKGVLIVQAVYLHPQAWFTMWSRYVILSGKFLSEILCFWVVSQKLNEVKDAIALGPVVSYRAEARLCPLPNPSPAIAHAALRASKVSSCKYVITLKEHDYNLQTSRLIRCLVMIQDAHIHGFSDYAIGWLIFVRTAGEEGGSQWHCRVRNPHVCLHSCIINRTVPKYTFSKPGSVPLMSVVQSFQTSQCILFVNKSHDILCVVCQ